MENKEKISQLGYVVAGLAWIALVYMMGNSFECVRSHSCSGGDFVLGAICAIGFLGPAYIVAQIVTYITKS